LRLPKPLFFCLGLNEKDSHTKSHLLGVLSSNILFSNTYSRKVTLITGSFFIHRLRSPHRATFAWLVVSLFFTTELSLAENNDVLSGHQNPFTKALERTTTASERSFKTNLIPDNTTNLSLFSQQRKGNTINQKKSEQRLSHKQTLTINAVLATGEFVSSSTDLLIYPNDDSDSEYKTGTSAINQLLKLSLKSWFKQNDFENILLNRLSTPKPIKLNNPTFNTNQDKSWDYSVKLSGEKIKLQFGKEL